MTRTRSTRRTSWPSTPSDEAAGGQVAQRGQTGGVGLHGGDVGRARRPPRRPAGDQQQRGRAHGHRPGQHEEQLDAEDDERERQPVPRPGGLRAEHQADAEQRGEAGDGERERAAHLDRLDLLLVGSRRPRRRAAGPGSPLRRAGGAPRRAGGRRRRPGRCAAPAVAPRRAAGPGGTPSSAHGSRPASERGGGIHAPIVPDRQPGAAVTRFGNVKTCAAIRGKARQIGNGLEVRPEAIALGSGALPARQPTPGPTQVLSALPHRG